MGSWTKDQIYREWKVAIGWSDAFVRCLDHISAVDISHNATQEQRSRYHQLIYLRASDDDRQGPPLVTRPGYKEARDVPVTMQKQSRAELGIEFIPKSERQRLGNMLDSQLQEYLVWLSTNWSTFFEKAHEPQSSSSSSQWSSTSWWSAQSWSSNWQGWHHSNWKKDDQWSDQR